MVSASSITFVLGGNLFKSGDTLNKIDNVQIKSREQNINGLENWDKRDKIASEEFNFDVNTTLFAGNGTGGQYAGGYSNKEEKGDLGVNILNENGNVKSAVEIEQSWSHEVIHGSGVSSNGWGLGGFGLGGSAFNNWANETIATIGGYSGGILSSLNTSIYGNGGLSNSNIWNYSNSHSNQLSYNSNTFYNTMANNPGKYDYESYMVSRPVYNESHHLAIVQTGTEDEINSLNSISGVTTKAIKIEKEMTAVGIGKEEDTHFRIISGFADEKKDKLIKSINDASDLMYIAKGEVWVKKIEFNNNNSTFINDQNIANVYNAYNQKADYPITAVPNSFLGYYDGYNSNSLASSVCIYGGGTNCLNGLSTLRTPGFNALIPKEQYFNK